MAERLFLNRPPYIRPAPGRWQLVPYPEITASAYYWYFERRWCPRWRCCPEAPGGRQPAPGLPVASMRSPSAPPAPRNNWGRTALPCYPLVPLNAAGGAAAQGSAGAERGGDPRGRRPVAEGPALASPIQPRQHSAALLRHCQFCIGTHTSALNMAVAGRCPDPQVVRCEPPLTHDPLMHASRRGGQARSRWRRSWPRLGELAPGVEAARRSPTRESDQACAPRVTAIRPPREPARTPARGAPDVLEQHSRSLLEDQARARHLSGLPVGEAADKGCPRYAGWTTRSRRPNDDEHPRVWISMPFRSPGKAMKMRSSRPVQEMWCLAQTANHLDNRLQPYAGPMLLPFANGSGVRSASPA